MNKSGINFSTITTNNAPTPIYNGYGSAFSKITENIYNHKLIETLKKNRNRSCLRVHSYRLRLGEKGFSE